ncbi:MAG TPA: hypothetical protein VN721_14680 [Flavipsychrobacter sp.]|nr:hypothetical protein [Flavipsychrobacter sp.]
METNNISVEVTFSRELTEDEQRNFMQDFISSITSDTLYHGGGINSQSFNITIDINESGTVRQEIVNRITNYLSEHNDIILKQVIE